MKNKTEESKMKKINVVQTEDMPIAVDIMAASIVTISDGIKKLLRGPLNEDALIMLIQHAAPSVKKGKGSPSVKVSYKQIKSVIQGINNLAATYLKTVKP